VKSCRTIADVRAELAPLRTGEIGLVPTMGGLHAGHLSLLRAAREECDAVVMSLFVNPAQFGDARDLASYPRNETRDLVLAEEAGVDLVFAPTVDAMYPDGFQTWVEVTEIGAGLEGAFRPGHFRGVATVVLKLFSIVRPNRAYFGQKDAQQAAVLLRMVVDLDLELRLRVVPTVRDADGLALSSRNGYLSTDERRRALTLPRALAAGREAFRVGSDPVATARAALNGIEPDYVDVVDLGSAKVLAAAARVGSTRLIDNVVLEGELE
jgi:pantoate--beta-alanine ligase